MSETGILSNPVQKWYHRIFDIRYMLNQNLTPDAKNLITYNNSRPQEDWVIRRKAIGSYLGNYRCQNALTNLRKNGYAVLIRRTDPVTKKQNVSGWLISSTPTAEMEAKELGLKIVNPLPKTPEPLIDSSLELEILNQWNNKNVHTSRKPTGATDLLSPVENQLEQQKRKHHSKTKAHNNTTLKTTLNKEVNNTKSKNINRNRIKDSIPDKKQKSGSNRPKRKNPFAIVPRGTRKVLYETWKDVYEDKFECEPPSIQSEQHRLLGTHIPLKLMKELMKGSDGENLPDINLIDFYWRSILASMDVKTFKYYPTPKKINNNFAEILSFIKGSDKSNKTTGNGSSNKGTIRTDLDNQKKELWKHFGG